MKKIRYFLEAVLLHILFTFFKMLSPEKASNTGGWIGKTIGPNLSVNRKAKRHLENALPEKKPDEIDMIISGMWDNLGRVMAEYPHLEEISKKYTEVIDNANLPQYLEKNIPVIFIGAHIGNWEINGMATLTQLNHPIDLTYRAPNNPWAGKLLEKARTLDGKLKAYPKSMESGRLILQALKNSSSIGILVDQKYNEGIESNFFSLPAMTNPIFVQLSQKFKCPVIPVRNERIKGCKFRLTVCEPIVTIQQDQTVRSVEDVIEDTHKIIECWIKERPEQWIWIHKRWKSLS